MPSSSSPDRAQPDPAPDPALSPSTRIPPAALSAQELADLRSAVARLTAPTAVARWDAGGGDTGADRAAPFDVRLVGAGLDHIVLAVEGTDLLVRYRQRPDAEAREAAECEAQLLQVLSDRPDVASLGVDLPAVLAELPEREGRGGRIVRRVAGRSLLEVPASERAAASRLAEDVGRFLAALHAVPVDLVDGLVERDDFGLADWRDATAEAVAGLRGRLPDNAWRALAAFVEEPVPPEPDVEVLVHDDLGAEHVHVTGADAEPRLAGIVDWSDAALGDPAADVAPLLRDCGPAFLAAALDAYRRSAPVDPGLADRALFLARCRWVEDQAYALDTGDPVFAEKARDSWGWLFDRGVDPPVTL